MLPALTISLYCFCLFSSLYFEGSTALLLQTIALGVAAVLSFQVVRVVSLSGKSSAVLLLFLTTSLGVFFHSELYFYWDEWHVLEHFSKAGIQGTLHTHNEHFLPVFFFIYFTEALLFGNRYWMYLLVGYVFHTLNGFLLYLLLKEVLENTEAAKKTALAVAFLFVVAAVHAEVLHWAFTLAIVLSGTCTLAALLSAKQYLSTGSGRHLCLAIGAAGLAPLCFGNGFVTLPFVLLLALVCLGAANSNKRQIFSRAAILCGLTAVALVAVAGLYWLYRSGAGHGVAVERPPIAWDKVGDYIFVGWQLGTLLRGLGVISGLSADIAPTLVPSALVIFDSPELSLAFAGLLLLGCCCFLLRRHRALLLLFCSGQAMIVVSYLLPALGRWQLGVGQSLSLRYTYIALIGLALSGAAVIAAIAQWERRRSSVRILGQLAFCGIFFTQLHLASSFMYFREQGVINQKFIGDLIAWQEQLCGLGSSIAESYEGTGTRAANKFPKMPAVLTPGRHPNDIYRIVDWLGGAPRSITCEEIR